jgi:PKD repeat protein
MFTYEATNLSVVFTDASIDPNTDDTLTWSWDFGDDSAANTTQSPTYVYAEAGTFNVTLTVTDTYGLTDDYTAEITVTE